MDNNNTSINPEFAPDAPEAEVSAIELPGAIPEINTIGDINTVEELPETLTEQAIPLEASSAPVQEQQSMPREADALPVAEANNGYIPAEPAAPAAQQAFFENSSQEVYPTGDIYQQTGGAAAPVVVAAPRAVDNAQKGEGLALTGFLLGLISLAGCWGGSFACYLCFIAAVAGIVFSAVAKKKGVVNSFQKSGLTLSIIGLVASLILSVSCAACTGCVKDMVPQEIWEQVQQGDLDALAEYIEEYSQNAATPAPYGNEDVQQQLDDLLEQLEDSGLNG